MMDTKREKAEGHIESLETMQATIKGQKMAKHWLTLKEIPSNFSILGALPEAWKIGEKVSFEYDTVTKENKDGSQSIYRNIKLPGRAWGGQGAQLAEIVKLLSMPKISVSYERTKQLAEYEPLKVSVHISQTAENAEPERIQAMLKICEAQVLKKIAENGNGDGSG